MKKILIIYPHFPPSNLAGVHRPRLFAKHLPTFGWKPTVLTVHERYYEEAHDPNLVTLLPQSLQVEKVKALRLTRPRAIGDIGLRSLPFLYRRAKELIATDRFDFLFIPIPSFYTALLGRWLHHATGIPYGIDYIDPWVHRFPGSERRFSRHWWSTKLASWLEPIAIKRASLITGVATSYYEGVLQRNPKLAATVLTGAMPYGGEEDDLTAVAASGAKPYLFQPNSKLRIVYAGAMLPKAFGPLESIVKTIAENRPAFADTEFHFIGTGKKVDDPEGFNIKPLAERYGLWKEVIFEHPARISYFNVLVHLQAADGIFVLGSTEPHYTPSKIYQGFLSGKPLFVVLHQDSTAIHAVEASRSGVVLSFDGDKGLPQIEEDFLNRFQEFRELMVSYNLASADHSVFEEYSAKATTAKLAALLDWALNKA